MPLILILGGALALFVLGSHSTATVPTGPIPKRKKKVSPLQQQAQGHSCQTTTIIPGSADCSAGPPIVSGSTGNPGGKPSYLMGGSLLVAWTVPAGTTKDPHVWFITAAGKRRWVPNGDTATHYFGNWGPKLISVTPAQVNAIPRGADLPIFVPPVKKK